MSVRTKRGNGVGSRMARAGAAVGVLLVIGGCATVKYKNGGLPNPTDPYKFTIAFDKAGCPVAATADFTNCSGERVDCVRVKGGQTVRFESSPPKTDFVLEFDPFGKNTVESLGGVLEAPAQTHKKDNKPYTFIVRSKTSEKCEPLDPQIILD